MRIKFEKGNQRKFLQKVLVESNSPSLLELSNRLGISYSTLKNYFSEARLLPESIFRDLLEISGLDNESFDFEIIGENWGKVVGGKKSKRFTN